MRRSGSALFLALVAVACSAETKEPIERTSSAVIGGTDSDTTDDAVVLLVHYDPEHTTEIEGCTGVLVAPDLVLTARHCVSPTDPSAICTASGTASSGGRILGDVEPKTLYVLTGSVRPDYKTALPKAARGREIVTDDAEVICDHDLALVLLDREIEDAKIAPLRLDSSPVRGELVTVVGWGISDTTNFPSRRQTRGDVAITSLGSIEGVGPSEFLTGESACAGDSGGPALAETGAVLGVLSRGGNGEDAVGVEACRDGVNIWSSVFGHAELVRAAFAKSDFEPWLEGQTSPLLAELGGACGSGEECRSGICNAGACTQGCDQTKACPGGWKCSSGSRKICVKDEGGGGCAVPPALRGPRGGRGALAFVLAFALAATLRRRGARPRSW